MASPAEPLLASNLYLSEKAQASKRSHLSTSTKAIDKALNGGFDFRQVHYITSETDSSSQDLIQSLLTSHLLSSNTANATIIDCTLTFDVRKLHQILQASLPSSSSTSTSTSQKNAEKDGPAALEILNRLKIMKIFDYIGLMEAVAEVQDFLEREPPPPPPPPLPKGTISDSEDEHEEDLLDDNDEGHSTLPPAAAAATTSKSPLPTLPPESNDPLHPHLLIISSLSRILSPLLKSNYTHGQAILASFLRLLGHLAKVHDLCILGFGDAAAAAATRPKSTSSAEGRLSMFKSCTMRSVLGDGTVGGLVDMHLYLHGLPKEGGGMKMARVLEVVHDRHDGRFSRWAAFEYDSDGRLVDIS